MHARFLFLRFLLLLFIGSWATVCVAVTVQTHLDRSTIMVGELASLTIAVEGGTPRSMESFPSDNGLSIEYRGQSQNTTIGKGAVSLKNILNFTVQATQAGQFTIPSIRIVIDGTPYSTDPVRLTVTKNEVPGGNRFAFLKLNVPKNEAYVGEVIPVEVQLYVTEADDVQAPQLKSDGFVIHKQLEATHSRAQIGNMIYRVLSFRMSVSAAKAGKLTLGPAETSLTLRLRTQPDPNDLFGFFGRYQRRPVTLSSSPVEMNVLPLPVTNTPPGFSGAIGKFTWTVNAGPTNLAAGDPITMKVVVSGQGNLDNVMLPEVNWPGFKLYPPNTSVEMQDQLGISGMKTFEQVIVPQSASIKEIPGLTLAYFDPDQKKFATLSESPIPVTIRPSGSGQAMPTVLATQGTEGEQPADRTDIVHIKADPGTLAAVAPPLVRQPWFLLLQAIPAAGFIGVSLWRRRQDRLANNPRLRRKIQVGRIVADGLAQLRQYAAANQPNEFYALVFRLLQEQLGERLDLPATAITEAAIDEYLPRRGGSLELIQELHALFQVCNQARYAPVQTDEEMQAIASNLEKALAGLQQLPD